MSEFENFQNFSIFLDKCSDFVPKWVKQKQIKKIQHHQHHHSHQTERKVLGKGASNITHVYRNSEKQETQAESPSEGPEIQQEQYSFFLKSGNKLHAYWRIC